MTPTWAQPVEHERRRRYRVTRDQLIAALRSLDPTIPETAQVWSAQIVQHKLVPCHVDFQLRDEMFEPVLGESEPIVDLEGEL